MTFYGTADVLQRLIRWCCLSLMLLALPVWAQQTATEVAAAELMGAEVRDETAAARDSVEQFHAALLAALRSGGGYQQRFDLVLPAIQAHVGVPTIARLSLGSTWNTLDSAARKQFLAALRSLIAGTYADRFATDSGQTFEVLSVIPGRRGPVVRSRLIRASGAPVSLDYHFRDGKIYNVVADGVSDLSLRRADYNSIIKQQGFQALLQHIAEQRETLAQGEPQTAPPDVMPVEAAASGKKS